MLLAFRIPNKVLKWLVGNLNRSHEDEKQYHESVMANLEREYSKLQTKLVTLYDDRLDQRITIEMYDRKVQEIKDKQEDILEQRKLHSKADKGFYIMASRILELANKSAELFESSEREQKRQLLQFVLQNCQLRGKNIDFTLKKPFDAILLANKSHDGLPDVSTVRKNSGFLGETEESISGRRKRCLASSTPISTTSIRSILNFFKILRSVDERLSSKVHI